jgi:hypothetical protein
MKDYEWNEEFTSQKAGVRAWLLEGKTITQLEALNRFGSLRLSAIIFDLREEGLPIITEKIQVSPRKRVAKYFIKPENLNN